jgi:hypothetical protein
MPDVDFAMTYPCYFLLTGAGNPESVTFEGDRCICMFTDRDLVESFYKGTYGDNFTSRTIEVLTCDCKEALINTLCSWKPQLTAQDVFYLAIDATPGRLVGRVLIREFVHEIEREKEKGGHPLIIACQVCQNQ